MKRLIGLLLVCAIGKQALSQTAESIANHSVDTLINTKMKALHIPGMAVAIIKNGKRIKVATYGMANLEWGNKVTEHTNFQIASCTKLLTSTLLLKTMNAGKIKLDDFVEKYVDSIPPQWEKLQIKHLITHSSGLRNFDGGLYLSTAATVKALKDSTLEYEPGDGQHYAQYDFMLLTYILEKIYNKPFVQLLHDEVTAPLGMVDGAFDMEQKTETFMYSNLIKQRATTYYDLNGKTEAYKFMYAHSIYLAGGYYASINDMANWAIGLDKETLFTKQFADAYIYSKDSVNHKLSEFTKVGWAAENENGIIYAGHSGGPGLGDVWRFSKQGYTFIVLTNDGELLPNFARAIASFYIKELIPKLEITKFER